MLFSFARLVLAFINLAFSACRTDFSASSLALRALSASRALMVFSKLDGCWLGGWFCSEATPRISLLPGRGASELRLLEDAELSWPESRWQMKSGTADFWRCSSYESCDWLDCGWSNGWGPSSLNLSLQDVRNVLLT
jgi:hypothetical protein